ncbi:hypothetical protein J7I94_19355 [Streptomyces sp. ISL-12]|uniref:hypothetical protein n=1 Tax=Streptomyces sp. ISL-12 TaxID=2819177 RepID=UPI001BE61759|nr:hypothetical protein [Streptomyces sp. ISL-12]MBT2412692.1 hypothetical protein [Streptomyces sp. ISL-12]
MSDTQTLRCKISDIGYAEAYIDDEGDVRLSMGGTSSHIYTDPAAFLAFAQRVCGSSAAINTDPVKVGDYVEVTKDRDWTSEDVGKRGCLLSIDSDDIPYEVDGVGYVMEVRRIDAPASSGRASLVTQARSALEGTAPSAADIIRLAEFLAG